MTMILSALTDEELVRFVDRSNPVVDELARRLERLLYGPRATARAVPAQQLALPLETPALPGARAAPTVTRTPRHGTGATGTWRSPRRPVVHRSGGVAPVHGPSSSGPKP